MTVRTAATPAYDHIVVVVEENHAFGEIIGNAQAPYINSLANGGALLTNYHAITHPSEPNYFALYAGSTFNVADDGNYNEPGPTLATILQGNGGSFVGYVDTGSPRKHNPWESFAEGPTVGQSFSAFPTSDFSQLPSVAFVSPNQLNDMHDGTVAQGDQWLQANLDSYAQWAKTHNSLLVVVWDEDDGSASNQIPAILYGANINTGTFNGDNNHYDMLKTMLDAFQLAGPNNASTAHGIVDGEFYATMAGDAANDVLTGGATSDALYGGAGNDQMTGGGGRDSLYGGLGLDTAVYSGARSNYTVTRNADGSITVTDNRGGSPDGTDLLTSVERIQFTDATLQTVQAHDFNGDNASDILIQSQSTGQIAYGNMAGGTFQGWVNVSTTPGYTVVGEGRIAGDGSSDVVIQNASGVIDYANLVNGAFSSWLPVANTPGWSAIGVGDVNGDGFADVVIQSQSSGQIAYVNMFNGAFAGLPNVGTTPGWSAKAVVDVNDDGFADVVIQSQSSGQIAYGNMLNGILQGWVNVGTTPGWGVVGGGDVNGDGFVDIVIQSQSSGQIAYGNMLNGVLQGWVNVATTPGYTVTAVEDVNRDGYDDVVVESTGGSGQLLYANMAGGIFQNWVGIGGAPGWTGHTEADGGSVPMAVSMLDPGPQDEPVPAPVTMFDPGTQSGIDPTPVHMADPGPDTAGLAQSFAASSLYRG